MLFFHVLLLFCFTNIPYSAATNGNSTDFGSFARNEETEQSDIDVLIEAKNMTMFDILRLEDELQKIYQRKIDLVEYKAIKSSIKKYVFPNLVELI